jgi:hypothetical protein
MLADAQGCCLSQARLLEQLAALPELAPEPPAARCGAPRLAALDMGGSALRACWDPVANAASYR